MPLDKTCSVDAYKENIRTEINAGKSPAQATAIARSTIDAACKEEDRPVPEEIAKAKKATSREYLEQVLLECRRLIPGWMFAVIHRAALPSSGGNAARNRRLSAAEKVWVDKASVSEMTAPELKAMMHKLNVTLAAYKRQGKSTDGVIDRAKSVAAEMKKRGMKLQGGAASEAMKKGLIKSLAETATPAFLPPGTRLKGSIRKGFQNGEPEGGMHAHGLDRRNSKTLSDGPHLHLFVMPGTGEVFITNEDGAHAHELSEGGDATARDGSHSHVVMLANGATVETKLGGKHSHQLMVETSGFDGLHGHTLRMADGTEIASLSPGEFVDRFVDTKFMFPSPILSSREIANAVNEARMLRDQVMGPDEDSMPEIGVVIEMMAKGEKLPEIPLTIWEVVEVLRGEAYCRLADMDEPRLISIAKGLNLEAGDVVEIASHGEIVKHSASVEPHDVAEAESLAAYADEMETAIKSVPFSGPDDAVLVFVSASPSPLELARKEALAGEDGALFQERYLAPMGLTKSDVAAGFAIPIKCDPTDDNIDRWRDQLLKSLARYKRAKVVALGRVAKNALGPLVSFSMPHPAAVRRHGDSGEVDRKVRTICKSLDIKISDTKTLPSSSVDPSEGKTGTTLADSISELSKGSGLRVAFTKSVEEKQIVYGVILDPYEIDLHDDWIPPAEIEATAHDFLTKSRVVGLRHNGVAEAEVVESWVEPYPTPKDRELALQNLPHDAFLREFGTDVLKSGSWVMGAKLSDELWAAYKKGELDAFSIGGFSFKTQISTDAMPEVNFIDLRPQS